MSQPSQTSTSAFAQTVSGIFTADVVAVADVNLVRHRRPPLGRH